jgi:hypothetical protein
VSARNFFSVSGDGNAVDDQAGTVLSRSEVLALAVFVASKLTQVGELRVMVCAVDEYGSEIKLPDFATLERVVRCDI